MSHVNVLNRRYASQSCDLGVNALKSAGCLKHAQPGILLLTCHVIVRMVSGHHHKRS